MIRSVVALAVVAVATGHGALSFPRPRNAIDGNLHPWSSWSYPCDSTHKGGNCSITFCEDGHNCAGSCPISSHSGVKNALNASNGQSCYWFSNGCTVGCDKCDGTKNHVGHGFQKFLYKGMTSAELRRKNLTIPDPWNPKPGEMLLNPKTTKGIAIVPNCDKPTMKPTICDPRLRTMNTQATCGSLEDIYYWSPWRAPGSAPVMDACGSAGGRFPGQGIGGAGAQFQNSSVAKEGDMGSKLPPMSPQATWKAGSHAEVGWTIMAHHGGGYAYRLAPADAPLTEETFRKMPLAFVGPSILRWDGDRSTQLEFDSIERGWQTNEGTIPKGSTWRKTPIPTILWEKEGPSFEPVCQESEACKAAATNGGGPRGVCRCSGHSNGGPLLPNLEMVDNLKIPLDLEPGRYVLQWRWDCEETDQIWSSCSDIEVTAADTAFV
mmetsp:Transcript_44385/g.100236  ORF Transcript_44385/g.100236 Transcript_44385/m.100236 type:complete len:435 (-) Transcript_44385:67-1371(-)